MAPIQTVRPVEYANAEPVPTQPQTSDPTRDGPSTPTTKRPKGQGSGYVQLHYCEQQTKSGAKAYEQYYYRHELEVNGQRVKRSAYICKNKLAVVLEWECKKVAVAAILSYLGKML